jgi:hypothetical protein
MDRYSEGEGSMPGECLALMRVSARAESIRIELPVHQRDDEFMVIPPALRVCDWQVNEMLIR